MRVAVSGFAVLAQIIRESLFTGRIVREGLLPFPCDSARQFLRLVCFRFSHQPSVFKSEGFYRQQLKRLENRAQRDDGRLTMKSILISIVAAVLVVGCGGPSAPDISIHDAAHTGNIEAVKKHLASGADLNTKDSEGGTPLHHAAWNGHKEVAELLIEKGAVVNALGVNGTPLDWAIFRNHTEAAALLRKHGGKTGEELKVEGE